MRHTGRRVELESDPQSTSFISRGYDPKMTNLIGLVDVVATTGASVVIADVDDSNPLTGAFRKARQVIELLRLRSGKKLLPDGEVSSDHLVDVCLNLFGFVGSQVVRKAVVRLRLLLLEVRREWPGTPEHRHQRRSENMLRRMHPRVNFLPGSSRRRMGGCTRRPRLLTEAASFRRVAIR